MNRPDHLPSPAVEQFVIVAEFDIPSIRYHRSGHVRRLEGDSGKSPRNQPPVLHLLANQIQVEPNRASPHYVGGFDLFDETVPLKLGQTTRDSAINSESVCPTPSARRTAPFKLAT